MSPRSRGANNITAVLSSSSSSRNHVCRSCRQALSRRNASTATAQATIETPPVPRNTSRSPAVSSHPQPAFTLNAGIVLSRPPLLTPNPHPFETAYYLYQRRLNERLVLPFTQYFYFKRGSPAFEQWRAQRRQRGGTAARDIGKYNPYGTEGWNDEVMVGDQTGDPQRIVEQLVEDEGRAEEFVGNSGDVKMAGLKRTTEADSNGDQTSLERSLSRTLYLLVRNKKRKGAEEKENKLWTFPSGQVEGSEGLKEAAQRVLGRMCGVNMNTWFVGNHPIGHYSSGFSNISASPSEANAKAVSEDAQKTFFMKARILAGQADVKESSGNLEDFRWLAKEEIQHHVHPNYWSKIKNMLVEQ